MKPDLFRPSTWPITVQVPLLVATLMIVVGGIVTDRVLARLVDTQERNLAALTGAYLDGLSSSILPHVLREDVWEIFDALDRARVLYQGLDASDTVVTDARGTTLAASDPHAFPTHALLPEAFGERFGSPDEVVIDENERKARVQRLLMHQNRAVGVIYAVIDVAALLAERQRALVTLLATNGALTLGFAAIGYLLVRRFVGPIHAIVEHMTAVQAGSAAPISREDFGPRYGELGRLFERYNAMVRAVSEREALTTRLAKEEGMASLGRLASGMAHEINNPLGGLFNALDTLKRHGANEAVRRSSISLLERGLSGIRDVVRSTLMIYRADASDRPLHPSDLDDLRLLIRLETDRKRLAVTWDNELAEEVPVPGPAVRQAALNLLLNACAATPEGGSVGLRACRCEGGVELTVEDGGPGLPADVRAYLQRPGAGDAPIRDATGLGLWMVRRLADTTGADVEVGESHFGGSRVRLRLAPAQRGLRHVA